MQGQFQVDAVALLAERPDVKRGQQALHRGDHPEAETVFGGNLGQICGLSFIATTVALAGTDGPVGLPRLVAGAIVTAGLFLTRLTLPVCEPVQTYR